LVPLVLSRTTRPAAASPTHNLLTCRPSLVATPFPNHEWEKPRRE
jgi:hypothetical protein